MTILVSTSIQCLQEEENNVYSITLVCLLEPCLWFSLYYHPNTFLTQTEMTAVELCVIKLCATSL